MNYGLMIKTLRTGKKENQNSFSSKLGISQTYLSQLEKGKKTPSPHLLERISIYVDIPLAILFWYSITEFDIKDEKRELFKDLKPSIDKLIEVII